MNKKSHRIVFNKHRGQFMAVSEVDTSQGGKTGASVMQIAPASGRLVTAIGAITLACMCVMGAVVWLMPAPAQAQVVAYRNAPATQQPTILQTSNRLPQVNIQTPSPAGVSRNLYSQFDVNSQGMILNNSRTNAQTQLGGWVQANPWLATGSARVILNEVYSSNPSSINGYIEVAGQRAEVVIANPAGLSVNGGGFINASKATLTTGTPIMNSGGLDGYRVQGGQVTVFGEGLDLARTDYAAIVAQSLRVNAGIWANELGVVTGINQVDANTLGKGITPQSTAQPSLSAVPAFALDVAQLGGMYAGKITLIGTEAGVGVRNAGTLDATAGNLVLQTNGWLTNTGTLQSSADMSLHTAQSLTNNGTLYAGGQLQSHSDTDQAHNGTTAAQGNVSLNARGNISAGVASLIAAGVQDNGQLVAGQSLDIQANGAAQLAGQTLATQNMRVRGASVDVSQGHLSAQQASLTASAGQLNAKASQITVAQALTLSTPMALTTEQAKVQAQQLNVQANRWNNTQGRIEHTGSANLEIDLHDGGLDNSAGTIVANAKDLSFNVGTLNNTGGVIGYAGTGQFNLNATSLANQSGLIYSEMDSRIQANNIDNQKGLLSAVGTLEITQQRGTQAPALVLDNRQGLIVSDSAVNITAGQLSNAKGRILTQGDMHVALQGDHTTSGTWVAKRDLSLSTTGQLLNEVSVQAGRTLSVSAHDIDNSASGELLSGATTLVNTSQTLTNRGLVDGSDTRIVARNVNNLGSGRIYGDRVAIASQTLTNQEETLEGLTKAGTIAARQEMNLGVQNLTNREGALIYSDADLAIGGQLDAQWRATGQANQLKNASATIEAAGKLNVTATRLDNLNLHFSYEQVQDSQTSFTEYQLPGSTEKLESAGGVEDYWIYNYTRTVTVPKLLSSAPGQLIAGKTVTLTLDSGLNQDSLVVAGGRLVGVVNNFEQARTKTEKITTDQGESYFRWIGWCGSLLNRHHCEKSSNHAAIDTRQAESVDLVPYTAIKQNVPATIPVDVEQTQSKGVKGDPIRTQAQPGSVPNSSLYKQHPETGAQYLIEADPRFTNQKKWLGSDYMLNALNLDPALTQKRLGDGFYEQKLIREQVASLTGQRFLGDYSSDEQEYMALMNNGLTFAKQINLRPGVALSDAQVAALTSDIVWLVSQEVTLADGSKQSVLVPQVYVRVKSGDIDGSGALLAGSDVDFQLSGDMINGGTIAGRNTLTITAENIRNMAGSISANSVALKAKQDIDNVGGLIQGVSALTAIAERDLNVVTTTQSSSSTVGGSSYAQTGIDRIAGLYVSGANATLLASAGRDMNVRAGVVSNAGGGSTTLAAVNNLNINTVTTSNTQNIVSDANNYHKQSTSQDVGSTIVGGGAVSLIAGQTLNAVAANVQATDALNVVATDIHIKAGQSRQTLDEATQQTSSGFLSKTTETAQYNSNSTSAIGSSLGGDTVHLVARHDIGINGSNIVGDNGTALTAANSISIEAAQNTFSSSSYQQVTKSGLLSGGGSLVGLGMVNGEGLSYGKQKQSLDNQNTSTQAVASTVGSLGGNVAISAGNQYKQVGSDVLSPNGNIGITAKTVDIVEARETGTQSTAQKFEKSGVTLAVTSTVLSTLENAQSQINATTQTSNGRMKALGTASAAANVKMAADALKAGQGDENGIVKTGSKNDDGSLKTNADGTPETAQANAADKAGGIQVSLSYGQSSSQINSTATSDTARGSTVKARGTTTIKATGAGTDSNLTVQGSDVSGKVVNLEADNKVNLTAAQNTSAQTSTSSNSSASVGIALQLGNSGAGLGFTGSVNKGGGNGNGTETTFTNTHIAGADSVKIKSGGETNVKGATVEGKQVTATVGGNLNVESLQDTATYAEKNQQIGASGMVGAGMSGSVNYAKSSINSTYASVTEQSGIKAGDGGFTVNVQGNTDLRGGAITSTQAAIDNSKNSFQTGGTLTTSDIENKASFDAKSVSVSVGAGGSPMPGQGLSAALSGAGMGKDSGSTTSKTTAGISGIAGDTGKRTGDNAQGIGKIFDADKVRQEIQAQTKITQEFSKQASTAVASYTDKQRKALQDQAKQIEKTGTTEEKAQAQQAIKDLNTQEKVLNILVGAVTGFGQTAVTKESLAAAADEMRTLMIKDSSTFAGVVDSTGEKLSNNSGASDGVSGDGVKLGGTRVDLDLLCGPANERCTFEKKADGSIDTSKPVTFNGNLDEFLASPEGQKMSGPTGGVQGYKGTLFGTPYEAGSWQDKLIESFAGTHDMIGGKLSGLYDEQGNIKRGMSQTEQTVYNKAVTTTAILPSVPFAAAQGLPPQVWNAIGILLGAAK